MSSGGFLLTSSGVGVERLGLATSSLDKFLLIAPGLRLGLFLTGDGESAMLPIDAFSSSTVAAFLRMSLDCNGLILILNFLCDSSSSSDSLEE